MSESKCGDKVFVTEEMSVTCTKTHDHPVVGFNHPTWVKKYSFHEGGGWFWDERCAWKKGEEPGPHD
jgi:hypothetical protein